jgi:hypothetical protein
MAKISTYTIDATPTINDKVIGTDVGDSNITKNYKLGDIIGLVPTPATDTLTATKMFYGSAANLPVETDTLTYIVGGSGSVAQDTTKIVGTLACEATHINNDTSFNLGKGALQSVVSPTDTVAVGIDLASTIPIADDSVLVGSTQLNSAQSIQYSVTLGSGVFQSITEDVIETVAIGYNVANNFDVTSVGNVLIGFSAARLAGGNGQIIQNNVVIGYDAASNAGSAGGSELANNIFIGNSAGTNSSGQNNIGIGTNTSQAANLGFFNVALGANTLQNQVGGDFNVALGVDALQQLSTGTTNTAVGKAAGSTVVGFTNTTNLGHNSQAQADNEVVLGDNNVTTLRCNTQVISALSDLRDKNNIQELPIGLDFILGLDPVTWEWDRRDGSLEGKKDSGFVAQDIDETIEDFEAKEILPSLLNKNNPDAWEVGNAALIPVLVKAIQELKAELDACKADK